MCPWVVSSFKPTGAALAMWGAPFVILDSADLRTRLARLLSVAMVIEPASRSHTLNGKRRAAQDLVGILARRSVLSPDDLELAKGSLDAQAFRDRFAWQPAFEEPSRHSPRLRKKLFAQQENALLKDEASDASSTA